MSFPLNSIKIGGKWSLKKQLFHHYNKFYVLATSDHQYKVAQKTLILMVYDDQIEQTLLKTIQRINLLNKQNSSLRVLVPEKPTLALIGKSKMFVMELNEKPVTVDWIIRHLKYEFTSNQIIESAISGLTSLSQLHSLNIIHGHINTKTTYFYNKHQRVHLKNTSKSQLITCFGLNITDIDKFSSKSFNHQDKIEDLLFQPLSYSFQIKSGFKEDVQSLLYVLIKMATKQSIFSQERYWKQWTQEGAIKKWKTNDLYLEMLSKVPEDLNVLIEIFLIIEEIDYNQKVDYSVILKKLMREKDVMKNKERMFTMIQQNEQISVQSQVQKNDSGDQIFEQDIKLDIRTEETGFSKLRSKRI